LKRGFSELTHLFVYNKYQVSVAEANRKQTVHHSCLLCVGQKGTAHQLQTKVI